MASTSRDSGKTGKAIEIEEYKLFSFFPINDKTYDCRELTFDNDRRYKKKNIFARIVERCSSPFQRLSSPARSAKGTSGQKLPKSPLGPLPRPSEESQAEQNQMGDQTVKDKSDDTRGGMSTAHRLFLEVPQTSEQPKASRRRVEAVKEDDNPNQTNEPWNSMGLLSFEYASDNPDGSPVHTPSTDQAVGTPIRSASAAGSIAASACPDSTNINGIMSLVCYEEYLYAIGVLVKGVGTTIVCRYPLNPVKKDGSFPCWEKMCNLPNRLPYHASCVFDGSIVVTGGGDWNCNPETFVSIIRLSILKRTTWVKCDTYGDLKISRRKHCVVAYADKFIAVLGGENKNNEKLNCAEISQSLLYECGFGRDPFELVAPMNHARSSFVAVHHSNFIYAIGGCEQEKRTGRITIECYSFARKQWTDLEGFDSGMRLIYGFEHKQKICIVGGDPRTCDQPKTTTQTNNPPTIVWKLPPAIDLPVVDLDEAIATTIGIVKYKVHE